MATKIKPSASGSYTTITADTAGCALSSSTGLAGVDFRATNVALEAINRWHNAGGTGEHATGAANTLAAVGMLIQEA